MLASVWVGCVTTGRMEGRAFVVPEKGYRVVPPAGWDRIHSKADLALRHPTLAAGLMAHATCEGKTPQRTLAALARHLRFGLRDVRDLQVTSVAIAGREGVRSYLAARLDGVPVAVHAVTLRGRGCVYDLVVVAPPAQLERVRADFERFVGSFVLLDEAQ